MALAVTPTTPGVYIDEENAFPNSVVAVQTAIPAFVGYTARADYEGKSYLNKPVLISSLQDFMTYFGVIEPVAPAAPLQQYSPIYYFNAQTKKPTVGDYFTVNGNIYTVNPDMSTIYYLYNSIRFFFANGGGQAYVVSVGSYASPSGKSSANGDPLINPNIQFTELSNGIDQLASLQDPMPTMLVVPDGTLLGADGYSELTQKMLDFCGEQESLVSIFDVVGGNEPDPLQFMNDITAFRTGTGMNDLKYGNAYYPFLNTLITQPTEIDYTNIGGGITAVNTVLQPAAGSSVANIIGQIEKPPATNAPTSAQSNQALMVASKDYTNMMKHLMLQVNNLPPSGAMAGVYTMVDNTKGVWNAPANVSINSVTGPTINLTDAQQGPLNVDALTGKSINAIRLFTGLGTLVWGARTLDGNSDDWRYTNVKRTMIMLEQSIKLAARAYVFEPNTANTWALVKTMIENFLTDQWSKGAVVGAKGSAFKVAVGLNQTMTAEDVAQGFMNITVMVAVSHPAEFIVITFIQQQQTA